MHQAPPISTPLGAPLLLGGGGPLPERGGPVPNGGGPPKLPPLPIGVIAGTEVGSTARLIIPMKPAEMLYPSERSSTKGLWAVELPWLWITPSTEIIAIVN